MEKEQVTGARLSVEKSCALIALTLGSWLGVSLWSWKQYVVTIPNSYGLVVATGFKLLHIPWMLFWLWGIHNFWHQTISLFPRRRHLARARLHGDERVAILYTTCDDFDPEACHSCLDQTYPHTRLIICDDSADDSYRQRIDAWAAQFSAKVTVVRRPIRRGFKAGNLNHVITRFVHEEHILVCDADEFIPPDFVARILSYFRETDVAFVQARHQSRAHPQTRFASLLGPTINLFYRHSLPLRNRFGFVSCFGHGVMIRRSVFCAIGGFPEIVSEDIGFASRALAAGFRGLYAEDVVAYEAVPSNYTAFQAKYRKIISGTVEYFQKESGLLVTSPKATWTEKLDLLLTFSYCYIGLVSMINLIGGLVLWRIYSLQGHNQLETWLLILYMIGPLTPIFPLAFNIFKEPRVYGGFLFSAAIAYVSLLPLLALTSIEQLLKLRKPHFEPTGKVGRQQQHFRKQLLTQALGLVLLRLAMGFRSQALAPTIAVSLMFLLGPLMCFTERNGILGLLARNCGLMPYAILALLMFIF
jgi:cellulose synthase/poly-beta-1,6-N-acetylglucosamine synthase-like glycosyltransferase